MPKTKTKKSKKSTTKKEETQKVSQESETVIKKSQIDEDESLPFIEEPRENPKEKKTHGGLNESQLAEVAEEVTKRVTKHLTKTIFPYAIITFWLIILGVAQVLWEKTLLSCDEDMIACVKALKSEFNRLFIELAIYSVIHFYIFLHSLFISTKYIKRTGFGLSLVSYWYRYATSHGFSHVDHSKANVQVSQLIIIILTIISLSIFITYRIFKYKKERGYIWVGAWILIWLVFFYNRIFRSCVNLQDSLDERDKYNEDGGVCRWAKGKICWHYTIHGVFRPFYWGRNDCTKMKTNLTLYEEM